MYHFLKHLLLALGRWGEHRGDKYVPKYNGQWVNKAKRRYDEDWQWEEKVVNLHRQYIHVFKQGKSSYLLLVDSTKNPDFALEIVECDGESDIELGLQLLEAYYGTLGTVTIDNPAPREDTV